jgi:hypothetical protein
MDENTNYQRFEILEKVKEVESKQLHINWIGWYKKRKGISENMDSFHSKIMLNGLVDDFYLVCKYYQEEIKRLKNEMD